MLGTAAGPPQRLVLYGSLRRDQPAFRHLGLHRMLDHRGPGLVRGTLYDLGSYPGFVAAGCGLVHGDLFAITDEAVLRRLDDFEGYHPDDPAASLYLRRPISLERPAGEAWIYVYNRDPGAAPVVACGDWLRHLTARSTAVR
jgi:gamma-glutamylcyclotransferase (GGCT)/AIG2-like uncharacterized protein YtfP